MTIADIVVWLIIGLIIGGVARFLVPGNDPMGCLATSLLGIAGAFTGGFLSQFLFRQHVTSTYYRPGFLVSLAGAVVVLVCVRALRSA